MNMDEDKMTFSEEVIERLVTIETLLTVHLDEHNNNKAIRNGIIIGSVVAMFTTILAVVFI